MHSTDQGASPLPIVNHVVSGFMTLWAAGQAVAAEAPWWMPLATMILWFAASYLLKRMEGREPRKALAELVEELKAERQARQSAERRLASVEGLPRAEG